MSSKYSSKPSSKESLDLNWVLKYLKDGVYPPGLNFSEKRMIRKRAERFCYLKGDLYYLGTPKDQELGKKTRKVLLTHEDRIKKVRECHIDADGTHLGLEKTAEGFISDFHWVGIYRFVKDFIRQCPVCLEKHPKMLQSPNSFIGYGEDLQDEDSSTAGDDSSICESESSGLAASNSVDTMVTEEDLQSTTESARMFWEKIDLRLYGPYKCGSSSKYVLVALDGYSLWPEAFALDTVSPATIAHSLLKMICRYGEMCNLVISCEDEVLEASLVPALAVLKKETDIHIPLKKCKILSTEAAFHNIEDCVNKFTKKYHKTWNDCIDYCFLPYRISRNKDAEYTPSFLAHSREPVLSDKLTHNKAGNSDVQLSAKERLETIDIMMTTHNILQITGAAKTVSKAKRTEVFATPQPSPIKVEDVAKQGYAHVTRSRTGNAKPKSVNEEEFESILAKRKLPATPNPNVQVRKRVKVEPVMSSTPRVDRTEDDNSDSETDVSDEMSKKVVDLDTYYHAIKQYVTGVGYPEKSSNSFKRLIRDQAKNYSVQDGILYHEVGVKGTLKKIVMTKEERIHMLRDIYLKNPGKSNMLAMLDSVHWKGKLTDFEAFLMAVHNDKQEPNKSPRDNMRNVSDAKKQLQYDTKETYNEIKNFIIYDVFSNDDATKRLDYLKRQMKNFRVENDELYNVMGNKKRPVVTDAVKRQQIITTVYHKKGASADLTSVFNLVSDIAFWFGMKLDVKVFLASANNKHLLERYFLFREHLMNEPLSNQSASDEAAAEGEEMQTDEPSTSVAASNTSTSGPIPVLLTRSIAPKHSEIYISSSKGSQSMTSEATPGGVTVITHSVSNAGDAPAAPSQTIIPDQPLVMDAEKDDEEEPRTVYVRLTEEGEAIISDTMPKKQGTDVSTSSTQNKASDAVTLAAVKTILQEPVSGQPDDGFTPVETIITEETVEVPMSTESVVITAPDGTDISQGQLRISLGENETVKSESGGVSREDGGSQTNEDELGDSDDALYDSADDDDSDEIYDDDDDNKSDASGLTDSSLSVITEGGEKKVSTPRQHFKCSQCDKLFYGPLKFKMHMYKHTGQKPFPCNLCNKKYTNKKSLVIHQRTHTGELPYLCNLCGKRCPSKIALKSHLKCHDGKGGGFPAKCDVCQRVFSRRHLMERHKLHKHTNAQSEFKCTECHKMFGHQRSLKRHFMSTHMGVKNHVCGMCGKAFCRKEYLTGHLIQHGATEGYVRKQRPSTSKPRPSVFNHQYEIKKKEEDDDGENKLTEDPQVQRIILTQDENGQLRMMDMAMEKEVRRMLDSSIKGEVGETMVVHIEEPSATEEQQVLHVEQTEEQVVEVPLEEHGYVEYQQIDPDKQPQEYVMSTPTTGAGSSNTQYLYTSSQGEFAVQGNQELIYGQPAVQYEVECVGDVGDEEALSAINLLAQASAQQYETVISQI